MEKATKATLSALGKRYPGICVVLYYHQVTDEQRGKFADQMDQLLRLAKPVSVENMPSLKSGIHYAAVTFDDAFQTSVANALPELTRRKIPVTVFVPTGCLGQQAPWTGDEESKDHASQVLTRYEIGELALNGLVSFGSHCISHRPLPTLTEQEAREEIFQSKLDLESILSSEVKTLSFPHGAFKQRDVDLARMAGYKRVFTIQPLTAFTREDEFVTGRVRVDPTDWPVEFRLKLLGGYRWLPKLTRRSGLTN